MIIEKPCISAGLFFLLLTSPMYQFAIIGCGRIAARHAENCNRVGRLKAVCDVVPQKADALAKLYDAKVYNNIDDLLKEEQEVNIVCVCTPNGLHAEHCIKSLQAGKHVLCEKPMCITSIAAWQMIDTAFFFRRKLFVVKQNRYNPGIQLLRKLLDELALGTVYSFAINCFWNRPQAYYDGGWKGTNDLDGGILYTQFSHFIDVLYWLLGDVTHVVARKENYAKRCFFDIEDTLIALLQMQNNCMGTLNCTINSYHRNTEGSLTIFGEKGTVKIGGQYLNTIEWFHIADKNPPEAVAYSPSNQYGFYEGSMSNHHLVYDDLINALNNNQSTIVEATEAAKTIEIIEKIYRAAQ
ncbi:MAG: Gfo/Idh/MocA family oxidoreductase [Flavisolibacter sp.]|nr:Gfo/Idh/MocA family oxidoreductase [Flavisolibacter sp.]